MTLLVTTDVQCDHEGCLQWVEGTSGHGRTDAREARHAANMRGWVYRNGNDYCPTHTPAGIRWMAPAPRPLPEGTSLVSIADVERSRWPGKPT